MNIQEEAKKIKNDEREYEKFKDELNVVSNFFFKFDEGCRIADLGLCRPANEEDQGKIYGVLPYVAPEVVREEKYTQATDVYSFGIVAYELFAQAYPYHDQKNLSIERILRGLRPNIDKVKIPQSLKDLIKRC